MVGIRRHVIDGESREDAPEVVRLLKGLSERQNERAVGVGKMLVALATSGDPIRTPDD